MPRRNRNRKRSKNARRVVAAENALSRVVRVKAPQKPRRSLMLRPMAVSPIVQQAIRYVDAVRNHRLEWLNLPSFRHTIPSTPVTHSSVFRLSTGAINAASVIINPYLAPFSWIYFEQTNPAATSQQYRLGPLLASNFTSPTGFPQGTNTATDVFVPTLSDIVNTGASSQYFAWVRNHGIRIRIDYTGTVLNEGALLTLFHGATGMNLCTQDTTCTTSQAYSFHCDPFLAGVPTEQIASRFRIGDRFECVLRPTDPEFKGIRANYQDFFTGAAVPAATVCMNQTIAQDGILQVVENGTAPNSTTFSHWGHNWGLHLEPAAGSSASVTDYLVTIEILNDEVVLTGNTATTVLRAATRPQIAHPEAEAIVRNGLCQHHAENARGALASTLRSASSALVRGAANTAASYLGRRVLPAMGKGLVDAMAGLTLGGGPAMPAIEYV